MSPVMPQSADDLARLLADSAARSESISLVGNNSKRLMGGPAHPADLTVSTAGLNRLLEYEPHDLTVSVEAGMRWSDLQALLREHHQMVALDPPFAPQSTVGGVLASNSSGPLRKAYGTARDLVIGMQFATLDGKLIRAGGMVVKNVAGLDLGKLLIGSFGTLAALTSVNFRLHARPPQMRSFAFSYSSAAAAVEQRNALQNSVLRPLAVDLLSPSAASAVGRKGYLLIVRAAGSDRVLQRYAQALTGAEALSGPDEKTLWKNIREFTPAFLARQPAGVIVRVSTPLAELAKLLSAAPGTVVARALSGVSYVYLSQWSEAAPLLAAAALHRWPHAVEFAPDDIRIRQTLWPARELPDPGFDMMRSVKQLFDPHTLLNRSRLYGRL